LRREYDLLNVLNIPGVVRPIALDTVEGMPMLVLEDAGPKSLGESLHRQGLEPAAFLDLAIQLAEVLGRVHAHNVIHGDLNPSNVVLADHRITLIDFSVATTVAELARMSEPDKLEGTLRYIAPEQTGRMNRPVDYRADFYSLGAIYYQML